MTGRDELTRCRDSALVRARGFVHAHGTALDRLRADALLGERPAREVARALEAARLASGAFGPAPALRFSPADLRRAAEDPKRAEPAGRGAAGSDERVLPATSAGALPTRETGSRRDARPAVAPEAAAGESAALASTCAALAILEELDALRDRVAEPAMAWLARAQRRDGSWSAEPEDARVALTAHLAAYLAKSRRARPAQVAAAGAFLAGAFSPERVKGGAYTALAAFAHFFSNAPHEAADEVLSWCGRELERGFRTGALDGLRTARLLALCDAQALPGARVDAEEAVATLLREAAGDGGFSSGGAPGGRVAATLAAIHAVRRLAV